MALDTTKQAWWYFSGLTSILFLQRGGIETKVSVTAGFSRGLALATDFPAAPWWYPIVNWPLQKHYWTLPWILPRYRQIVLLHHLLEELMNHVAAILSWLLTMWDNLDRPFWVDVHPFLSRTKIEKFAFATGFPVTPCSTFSVRMVSVASVT